MNVEYFFLPYEKIDEVVQDLNIMNQIEKKEDFSN